MVSRWLRHGFQNCHLNGNWRLVQGSARENMGTTSHKHPIFWHFEMKFVSNFVLAPTFSRRGPNLEQTFSYYSDDGKCRSLHLFMPVAARILSGRTLNEPPIFIRMS